MEGLYTRKVTNVNPPYPPICNVLVTHSKKKSYNRMQLIKLAVRVILFLIETIDMQLQNTLKISPYY